MYYIITKEFDGKMPQVDLPDKEILNILGEKGIRELISNHYDLLVKSEIKNLFPPQGKGLEAAKRKSADFFIQILGGERYYQISRGNPMLKRRHMPFTIDMNSRIVWLECYISALNQTELRDDLKLSFWNYIDKFSLWMINS